MSSRTNPDRYRKASELFQAVCDLPVPQRQAHLKRACGEDEELLQEVESLLEHHHPATTGARPATSSATAPRDPFRLLRGPAGLGLAGLGVLALLVAVRIWTVAGMETSLLDAQIREMRAALDWRVASLQTWKDRQLDRCRAVASSPELLRHARELIRLGESSQNLKEDLKTSTAQASTRALLERIPKDLAGLGFAIVSTSGLVLACEEERAIGQQTSPAAGELVRRALLGEVFMVRPYRHRTYVLDVPASVKTPIQVVVGPILDESRKPAAILALCFESRLNFATFFGDTAHVSTEEFFAFDEKGQLLTTLRDAADLKALGLVPEEETALTLRLRDPGGDLRAGFTAPANPDAWPMTRLSLSTVSSHQSGEDTAGYRNVRGREVIGAWSWLPEWSMGVGVEMERAEVLLAVDRIRKLFNILFAAVGLSTLAAVGLSRRFGLYRRTSEKGIAGTYLLDRRIGTGGTSEVYLAHHAHLKRPTAVKVLNVRGADGASIARFEREAMLVSRLSHPNTVQVYDYGRTRDGRFYLATEYLEGLNLAQLVALGGPLSPARAIHLLDQVCGSLEEAHAAGLVHRDIKPANIMVCRRGGLYDVVKVLDFGIARSTAEGTAELTQANQLAGTPLYIAPERIRAPQSADPRSDLYSLGAVAFHLLAGRDVFEGPGAAELLYQVLSVEPPSPSRFRGGPLPPDLERLVLDLLAKDPEKRPSSASAVRDRLSALETPERWDQRDARAWWSGQESRIHRLAAPPPPPG